MLPDPPVDPLQAPEAADAFDPAASIEARADEQRAFLASLNGTPDAEPPRVFAWEEIDGENVRVPQGADREPWIADYRRQREASLASTAELDAEVSTYAGLSDLERRRKYTPDVRAALDRMLARSPI